MTPFNYFRCYYSSAKENEPLAKLLINHFVLDYKGVDYCLVVHVAFYIDDNYKKHELYLVT